MMSDGIAGQDSPFHCVELGDNLSAVDPDMCSFYPDSMPAKSLICSLDNKAFTVDGGKVYANLEQSHFSRHASPSPPQVLPNIDTFSRDMRERISLPSPHDSGLPPLYGSNLSSPVTRRPPATLTGATPIVVHQTWRSKHPGSWTNEDVLDWIFYVAGDYKIDQYVEGEAFRDVTGQDLLTMPPSGFKPLTPEHYNKFYEFFTQLKNRSNFKAPQDQESPFLSSTSEHLQVSPKSHGLQYFDTNMGDPSTSSSHLDSAVIQINRFEYPVDLTDNFPEVIPHRAHQEAAGSDDGYSSGSSDNQNNVMAQTDGFRHQHHQHHHQQQHQLSTLYSPTDMPIIPSMVDDTATHIMDDEDDEYVDHDIMNNNMCDDSKLSKLEGPVVRTRGRKPGQTTRGNHLWEFVRDLLKDDRYMPKLIKWENREKGVFRFVQSAEVAKMWGRRKNNQTMNYEKLSRAMRFCRDKHYFAALPKGEKYPKKLCFRFGDRAHGWQTDD